jgi:hypothetical protein
MSLFAWSIQTGAGLKSTAITLLLKKMTRISSPSLALKTAFKGGSTVGLNRLSKRGQMATKQPAPKTGIDIITAERKRQVEVKGYTPLHDDEHDLGELGLAAALYALPYGYEQGGQPLIEQSDFINLHITLETGCDFYLDPEPDKLRRLAKAGALIAAEIDRLIRTGEYERGGSND